MLLSYCISGVSPTASTSMSISTTPPAGSTTAPPDNDISGIGMRNTIIIAVVVVVTVAVLSLALIIIATIAIVKCRSARHNNQQPAYDDVTQASRSEVDTTDNIAYGRTARPIELKENEAYATNTAAAVAPPTDLEYEDPEYEDLEYEVVA